MKGITDAREKRAGRLLALSSEFVESKDQKLGTFSGGMKQRFGIAQALLGDPKIIIVDQPLG